MGQGRQPKPCPAPGDRLDGVRRTGKAITEGKRNFAADVRGWVRAVARAVRHLRRIRVHLSLSAFLIRFPYPLSLSAAKFSSFPTTPRNPRSLDDRFGRLPRARPPHDPRVGLAQGRQEGQGRLAHHPRASRDLLLGRLVRPSPLALTVPYSVLDRVPQGDRAPFQDRDVPRLGAGGGETGHARPGDFFGRMGDSSC